MGQAKHGTRAQSRAWALRGVVMGTSLQSEDFCVSKSLRVCLSTRIKGNGGGVFLVLIMIVVDKAALKYTISLNGKHTESFYHYIWP